MTVACTYLPHLKKYPEKDLGGDKKWPHTHPSLPSTWEFMAKDGIAPTWETNGKHRSRTVSGPEGPRERNEAIEGPTASHRGICSKQGRKLTQLTEFLIFRMHVYSCKLSFCP